LQHLVGKIRHVDGIAHERFIHRDTIPGHQRKMQLMDVEGMQFGGAIFNDPVLDIALPYGDVRRGLGGIEYGGRLTVDSDEKRRGAVGILRILERFGEIQLSGANRGYIAQPGQLRRAQGRGVQRQLRQCRRVGGGNERGQRAIRIVFAPLPGINRARHQ
jgi:hypothetical protein